MNKPKCSSSVITAEDSWTSFLQHRWTTALQAKGFRSLYLSPFLSQVIAFHPKQNSTWGFFPPVSWSCTHPRTEKKTQLKRHSQIISDEWQHQPTQKCKNHQGLYQTESSPGPQASTTFWDNLQFLWPPHCILSKTQDKRKYTPEDEDVGATATSLNPDNDRKKKPTISI